MNILRRFFLRLWVKRLRRSFQVYLVTEYGTCWFRSDDKHKEGSDLRNDIERYVDCAFRAHCSTWFEWTEGSTIFYWRWPKRFRRMARDGIPLQVSYLTLVFRMQPENGDLPLPDQVLRQDPWYTSTINMLVFTSIKISGKKPRDT